MKKASKILTLILIVVFVLSVFAGCDLVGRNTAKYRSTTAMTVGDQKVTIGKLLDTFNSYYNSYYYYISAGYLTADSLLEMVMNSLMQQYIQIDDYVQNKDHIQTPALKDVVNNAEYLTQEQFEYCIKYVKYTAFTTFDSAVITTLSVKHDIGDAKDEDTSRDFTEWDDLDGVTNYADYVRDKNFENEDANEYFDKYYSEISFASVEDLYADYIYKTEEAAKAILDELQDRLEDDSDEITFDEYQDAQTKAIEQYEDTIKNNYGIDLQEFLKSQVADMVSSCIIALWSYEQYKDIHSEVVNAAKDANKTYAEDQAAQFKISKNFDSFITSLTDSSYIYNVPVDMQHKYVFVKNILIPFSSEQTARLNAQDYGTDTPAYERLRNQLASEIAAEYFDSDKYDEVIESEYFSNGDWFVDNTDEDSDRKYEKLTGLFKAEQVTGDDGEVSSKIAINPTGVLAQFFGDNGEVTAMAGKDKAQTIVELMKRFNTDTAQHSTRYDYVVYVGEDWENYSHSWVKEFYTAVNELGHDENGNFKAENIGKYTLCVSTYGVHIIYVDSFVEEHIYKHDTTVWETAWQDSESMDYVRYKAEFEKLVTKKTKDAFEKLEAKYLKGEDGRSVTINKQFSRFLKDNGFTFNFDEFKEETLAELDVD
ncbi:MAG: hypothetical protein J1F68_03070 [Clostridiales bacterium]|nr:hypothetical protein [Clostridiales bacterium]